MDDRLKYGAVGVGVIAVILLMMHRRDTQTVIAPGDSVTTVPGAASSPGFNSTINVDARPTSFAQLSNQYMPVFGMVGVGVVNTGPSRVNVEYNTTIISAPTVPRYMIPGLPAALEPKPRELQMSIGAVNNPFLAPDASRRTQNMAGISRYVN